MIISPNITPMVMINNNSGSVINTPKEYSQMILTDPDNMIKMPKNKIKPITNSTIISQTPKFIF